MFCGHKQVQTIYLAAFKFNFLQIDSDKENFAFSGGFGQEATKLKRMSLDLA